MLTAIVGINWGDEGKGRMVDLLSADEDVVVRYQGGNNAGPVSYTHLSPTHVEQIFPPEKKKYKEIYEGSGTELAESAYELLLQKKFI